MRTRLELNEALCEILGSRNVYFQPPENTIMQYPCIRYSRYDIQHDHADNQVYLHNPAYQIIVIDPDADHSEMLVEKISKLPMCSYDRHYEAKNLYHDVFTIYL